jgi:hypothetical protein
MVESAGVFQQAAKQAGANIKLDVVADTASYYGSDAYYTSNLKSDSDSTENMFAQVSYSYLGKGLYNNTGYQDRKVEELYLKALAGSPQVYQDSMHEISRIINQEGPYICWGHQYTTDVYSKKFTGAVPTASGQGFNGNQWAEIGPA